MLNMKSDFEIMCGKGLLVKKLNPTTGREDYYLTRKGWLYGQYQRVIRGEYVTEETLRELKRSIKFDD